MNSEDLLAEIVEAHDAYVAAGEARARVWRMSTAGRSDQEATAFYDAEERLGAALRAASLAHRNELAPLRAAGWGLPPSPDEVSAHAAACPVTISGGPENRTLGLWLVRTTDGQMAVVAAAVLSGDVVCWQATRITCPTGEWCAVNGDLDKVCVPLCGRG